MSDDAMDDVPGDGMSGEGALVEGVIDDGAVLDESAPEDALLQDVTDDDASTDYDAEHDDDLPVISDEKVGAALEAVLLVVDAPVSEEQLAAALGRSAAEVRDRLLALAEHFTARGSGIDLREAGGGWRFYTRDEFAPVVERFVLDGTQTRLSKAALETLAVIAYRQPVTRARISAVRGVNVDGVVRTLLARGLIEEEGTDHDTGGILYRTTDLFLDRMGLGSLEDLPPLGPLLPDVDQIDDE